MFAKSETELDEVRSVEEFNGWIDGLDLSNYTASRGVSNDSIAITKDEFSRDEIKQITDMGNVTIDWIRGFSDGAAISLTFTPGDREPTH